jgi:hypothetical protein
MRKKYLVIKTYALCDPSVVKAFCNIDAARQFCAALNSDNCEETGTTDNIYFIAVIDED